jgi:hypothetical protein
MNSRQREIELKKNVYFEVGSVITEIHEVVKQSIGLGDYDKALEILRELTKLWGRIMYKPTIKGGR